MAVLAVLCYCMIDITSPFIFPESMQDGVEVWKEAWPDSSVYGLVRLL